MNINKLLCKVHVYVYLKEGTCIKQSSNSATLMQKNYFDVILITTRLFRNPRFPCLSYLINK